MMVYAKNSWKSFMIECGLDQYEAQSNVPIAHTYTNDQVTKELLKDFVDIHIWQTHIFKFKIAPYKAGVYEEEEWFKAMPQQMKDALEAKIGWHLCITCTKPL
jgi:hypothetical protein